MPSLSWGLVRALAVLVTLALAGQAAAATPSAERRRGAVDGLWYWRLPDAPSGTRPIQSWSGAGSTPDGTIYIAGMDHVANSVLYRLPIGTNPAQRPGTTLSYAGDARASSQTARTWRPGDVAEKFHTRPTWHRSQIWVATLNDSNLDDSYLQKNGFRWYQYNPLKGRLNDRGLGAARGGLVAIAADHLARRIYGTMLPTGQLYAFDVLGGQSALLGRPDYGRPYVYAGRALWIDQTGRVHFTAGSARSELGAPYDPATFNHVHYWDPATGFGEQKAWQLRQQRAIDMAQCFPSSGTCYLGDDDGNLYRFREAGGGEEASWTHLARPDSASRIRVMQISPDQDRAYFINNSSELFELDLATTQFVNRVRLRELDPVLDLPNFYGHDAWDLSGRFYIAAFGHIDDTSNAWLVAIDPARLLAAAASRR